jgi:hypothetical protein
VNDIAEFFHNERHTVGQSYETALMLARSLVEASWRDMGTAPRDGTPILCFRPDAVGHGFSDQSGIDVLWWEDGSWTYDGDGRVSVDPPTHWMPLPAAPPRS